MKIDYTKTELALIFIDGFLNLDYKHKRAIINLYNDVSEIFNDGYLALEYLTENISPSAANTFRLALEGNYLNEVLKSYEDRQIVVVTEESNSYPDRLYRNDFRPICLYAKGNVKLLTSEKTFSIVGSRKTSQAIMKITENFATDLTYLGVTLVTGVADGGDKAVIKGAVSSGKIICVLASGFDFIKSEQNRDYIEKVIENGLVVTEYPAEIPPKNYHYPIRNRIIAGLGDGVMVVSGNLKSGTRYTADYGLDYGKEVFAFPYSLGDFTGELCNALIKDGAHLVTTVDDISEIMNFKTLGKREIPLSSSEREIYELITSGVNNPDLIAINLNKKIFELIPLLTSLELKGVVVKNNRNEYTAIK